MAHQGHCGHCGHYGCYGPCHQCGCGYIVELPEHPDAGLSFQNQNITGVGMFDNQTGSVVGFRGVASANGFMTVALDAPNKVALFTIDVNALAAAMPAATTTQAGVLETATDAEAIAKTATDKIVTPSNFAAMASSQVFAGLVELATDAETIAGVSSTLAVTPAGLAAVLVSASGTETWADALTRTGATPDFAGQFGVQLDSDVAYIASGAAVGDFDIPIMMLGSFSNVIPSDTTVDLNSHIFNFFGGTLQINDNVSFGDATVTFSGASGTILNFANSTFLQIGGVAMQDSVFTTGIAGEPVAALISTFISTQNTQTGWAIINPSIVRTLDVATATLSDVRAVLGTLINDLKAVQLPAT